MPYLDIFLGVLPLHTAGNSCKYFLLQLLLRWCGIIYLAVFCALVKGKSVNRKSDLCSLNAAKVVKPVHFYTSVSISLPQEASTHNLSQDLITQQVGGLNWADPAIYENKRAYSNLSSMPEWLSYVIVKRALII